MIVTPINGLAMDVLRSAPVVLTWDLDVCGGATVVLALELT